MLLGLTQATGYTRRTHDRVRGGGCDIFFWVENLRQAYKISLAQEICHIFWSEKICIFLGDDLHNVMCVDVAHTGG